MIKRVKNMELIITHSILNHFGCPRSHFEVGNLSLHVPTATHGLPTMGDGFLEGTKFCTLTHTHDLPTQKPHGLPIPTLCTTHRTHFSVVCSLPVYSLVL